MTAEIMFIAGLPGSGKTIYMTLLRRQGWTVFDDFKADAHNNSSVFWHSRNYEPLLNALRYGQKCIVADIDFCNATSRSDAESTILTNFPALSPSWLFFANDVEACRANIVRRASRSMEDNLRALATYQPLYRIPAGTQVLPVWTPSA